MRKLLRHLSLIGGCVMATVAVAADITFYERDGFRGRSFTATGPIQDFSSIGFNDRASSLAIRSGSWQVCSDAYFRGRCVNLAPGDYPSLSSMGLDNSVSSVRPIGGQIGLFDLPNFGGRGFT